MNTKSLAFLSLLASITTVPAWASYTFTDGALVIDGTVDLAGSPLQFEGITSITGTGEFKNTAAGDAVALTLDIPAGTIGNGINNCKIKFSGNLRLVKTGDGTFMISSTTSGYDVHTYTGGTEIRGGTITSTKYAAMTGDNTQYGKKAVIDVYPGGKVDMCSPDHNKTTVNLYGGEITGPIKQKYGDAKQCAAKINLEADSYLKPTKQFGVSGPLDLKGHTLIVNAGDKLEWKPSSVTAGKILLEKGTLTFMGSVDSPETDLEILKVGGLALGTCNLDVKDFVTSNTVNSGSGELRVHGTFLPWNDTYYAPIMQDGSTIDLSTKKDAWAVGGTTFADGATINIEVGSREVVEGNMIVTWSGTEYNGRTFNLTVDGVISQDLAFQPQSGGLLVISTKAKIPTAIWSGAKSADALDPDNWSWRDAPVDHPNLPDGTYVVEIAWNQLPNLNWPETNALGYASLAFTGEKPQETVALTGNRDWRGLGGMDVPYAIDLAGKTLAMTFKDGTSAAECEVTSSVEGGVLIAKVADDKTFDNTLVTLSGNLMLVKDGEGTFVATKCPQEYTGVTIVSNGVLKCVAGTNVNATDKKSPFGAQLTVTVAPDGVLDPAGSYGWANHTINLEGGMISNTVEATGLSSGQYGAARSQQFNPTINLLASSTFATAQTFNFEGKLTSNGNKLTIWIGSYKELLWYPSKKVVAADLEVVSDGYFRTISHGPVDMRESTLTMTKGGLFIGGILSVSNYVTSSTFPYYRYDERPAGDEAVAFMNVYGTFKPTEDYFFGCTMQDGSAIDLSERDAAWSIATKAKATATTGSHVGTKSTVDFADGAKVTIDTGDREMKSGELIVGWTTKPGNLEKVKFVLKGSAADKGMRITVREDGIAVRRGLVFMVQ